MTHIFSQSRAFTLLETMVAVTLLTVAIVAPMSLTTQSLASAYYARDEITASYLAQEAIEAVRSIRDGNVLLNSQGTSINLFDPTWIGTPFTIDTRTNAIATCSGTCGKLQTDGSFYGYGSGWIDTQFTRTVNACYMQKGGSCTNVPSDEVKITVVVTWSTGPAQLRTFTMSEDLYRWVTDGSASAT